MSSSSCCGGGGCGGGGVVVVGCRHPPRAQRSSTVDPTSWQCRAQPLPSPGAQTSSRILSLHNVDEKSSFVGQFH